MVEECKALTNSNLWSLVPYQEGMHVVGNQWVFRMKCKPYGTIQRCKAHLHAKGFLLTLGIDYFETLSLVVRPSTIRVILKLAASKGWDIKQIDVKMLF